MRGTTRHLMTILLLLAGSLYLAGSTQAMVQEEDPADAAKMRHVRGAKIPYTVSSKITGATMEVWQYTDPATGFVGDLVARQLVVVFDPSSSQAQRDAALQGFARVARQQFAILEKYGMAVVEVPGAQSVVDLVAARQTLRSRPGVQSADLNYLAKIALTPNDPLFPQQQHHAIISTPAAWDILAGSQQVVVAIIDTGVDYQHEDLAQAMWTNPGEIPGNGLDDDLNGFVDDYRGWDFINNDNDPFDDQLHGTHVAGLAAAIANNSIGVAGTGFALTIMPVKVLSAEGTGSYAAIASGIFYAAENGADVLNMSLRAPFSEILNQPILQAYSRNAAIVVAAGNESLNLDQIPLSPVCNDGDANWVLGVAATNDDDTKAIFSNFGSRNVDVAAPGVNLLSTFPIALPPIYQRISGTSMSSPVVAGVVGLLKGMRRELPVARIYAAISEFADNIDAQNPLYVGLLGGGRLNAYQSLLNVDIAGIVAEIEPNDDFDTATPLVSGVTVEKADISAATDVDFFSFSAREGDVVDILLFAQRLDPPSRLHPYMTLYGPDRITELAIRDGRGQDTELRRVRLLETGTYYVKVEDRRNRLRLASVGGPEYFYQIVVNFLPLHPLPEPNIVSPFSPPTAVIGINLSHPSGAVFLEEITVRFETAPGSPGRIEPSDFQGLGVDDRSGVAIYRDGQGPNEGVFDFSDFQVQTRDQLIVPTESPSLRRLSASSFEVTLRLYDPVRGLVPNPLTFVPANPNQFFDFFIVVRTSGSISHGESFIVTIPPNGLRAVNRVTTQRVTFQDQGFGSASYPDLPRFIFGEAIRFVDFTDVYQTIEKGLDAMSAPVPFIGINAVGSPNDGLYLEQVTVTLVAVPPKLSFLNVPGDNVFTPSDLAPLTGDQNSGLALYRDNPAGASGIFEEGVDFLIPLDDSRLFYQPGPLIDGATSYVVNLVPRDDVSRQLLTLPSNDIEPNNGSDFYVVVRTSDRIRDGDTFRLEVRRDPATGQGGVLLNNDSDLRPSRRQITQFSRPTRTYNVTARPKPRFFFTDLTGNGLRVPKESRAIAVVGINAVDFGANQLDSDGDSFGWFFDSITVDFLDFNKDGDFTQDDLRPLQANVSVDRIFGEYRSGVMLYMDDSTPIEDGIDDDGDGMRDEELLNGVDDDGDGLVDEDVGDDDPAGINGVFDDLDDYIPFFFGSVDRELDPDNPRFPGTGLPSTGSGHHFNLTQWTFEEESVYPQAPTVTPLAEGGFSVNFKMEMYRWRERHLCSPPARTAATIEDPLGFRFARASEMPLPGIRGPQEARGQGLECFLAGNIRALPEAWHSEGIGMFDTDPTNPCCSNPEAEIWMSYNYVIEIPDNNEGANEGDDFYVVIRTSNTISHGDDFQVRIDAGSIRYRNYKTVDVNPETLGNNNIAPGANESSIVTGRVVADVPINLRINDLTTFQQRVDPLTSPEEFPLPVMGLDFDVASQFPEVEQPGFSPEQINSLVVEFVDRTPARSEIEPNDDPATATRLYLGDTGEGVIQRTGDVDYFYFIASRTTRAKVQVLPVASLASEMQVFDANGPVSGVISGKTPFEFDVVAGQAYRIKVNENASFLSGPSDTYTLLTWEFVPGSAGRTGQYERRGFQVSNDPLRSDLMLLTRDALSGIALYIDDGTREGVFEPTDSLLPLSNVTPSIEVSGDGSSANPFVYRVPLILGDNIAVPFDNAGTTAGNDAYVVIRPSAQITFGDAFTVRIRKDDIRATAPILASRGDVGETNRLTANVTTVVTDLTTQGQRIVNGSAAPLPTATAIFGLDVNDGAGGQEKLVRLRFRFDRGSVGTFTINDISPITGGPESGVALYRNRGARGFDENEDELVPFSGAFSGNVATLSFTAGGGADVPDDNFGENEGIDYFVVIRTSPNITYETPTQVGDRFLVGIPFEDGIRFTSGFVKKSETTFELIPELNLGPTFAMTRPVELKESPSGPPDAQEFTAGWIYSDSDSATVLQLFIDRDRDGRLAGAVAIPGATFSLPASAVPTEASATFSASAIIDLASRVLGPSVKEVYVAGRLSDGVNPALIAYSTGTWNVASGAPSVAVDVRSVDRTREQFEVAYGLGDRDSPASGILYLGPANLIDATTGLPRPEMAGRFRVLDDTLSVAAGETVERTRTYSFAGMPDGVYYAVIVGTDQDNIVIARSVVGIAIPSNLPIVRVEVNRVDSLQQQFQATYSLRDLDTPATGALYLGPIDLLDASGQPRAEYLGRFLKLDVHLATDDQTPTRLDFRVEAGGFVEFTQRFSYSQLPRGVYYVILAGFDEVDKRFVQAIASLPIEIPRVRWPVLLREPVVASPLVADLVGDSSLEVVVVTKSGLVNFFSAVGGTLHTPVQLRLSAQSGLPLAESSPALFDLAPDDNRKELLVAVSDINGPTGSLFVVPVYEVAGQLLQVDASQIEQLSLLRRTGPPTSTARAVVSTPAVANIDSDATPEAVIGTGQGDLVAVELGWNATANRPVLREQWRVVGLNAIQSSPAVGQVDRDPALEIVVYTDSGDIYILESPDNGQGAPVLEAPYLVGGTQPGVYAVAVFSPSLGDVDGDGMSEIVIATPSLPHIPGQLYILDGDQRNSSPVGPADALRPAYTLAGQVTTAAALADIDRDGKLEIILASEHTQQPGGVLYGFKVNAAERRLEVLFAYRLPAIPASSPVVGDWDPAENIFLGLYNGRLASVYYDPVSKQVVRTPKTPTTVYDFGPLGGAIVAPPFVADLDSDGQREVLYVSNNTDSSVIHSLESDLVLTTPPEEQYEWVTFKHDNARTGDIAAPLGIRDKLDLNRDGEIDYRDLFLRSRDWLRAKPKSGASGADSVSKQVDQDTVEMILFLKYWRE